MMDHLELGFSQEDLVKLAQWKMPFGKYKDARLIDLPEAYLFWFHKRSFPNGELGKLMALSLELKIEGLDGLVKQLKNTEQQLSEQTPSNSSALKVRALTAEEIQLFSQLVFESYSALDGFPSRQEQPGYYKLLANLDKFSVCSSVRFLGAFSQSDDLLGGVIYFGDMKDYGSGGIAPMIERASGVRFLAVNANSQGQGIGQLLTRHCIKLARENGQKKIILHTIEIMKAAWSLYQGLGFKRSIDLDFFENDLHIYGFQLSI